MTNHHVGRGQLQKLSTAEHDLLKDGFYAATADGEIKCKDLEVNILWSIEDVTYSVNASVSSAMSAAEANAARQERIAEITKRSQDETGLKSEVVTLYHGARYHLYRYKRFADVRLVMAPESRIAAFGGDVDNFEYPRFCLDVSFFRIYEDGKPLSTPHYLNWSPTGTKEGELVFVAGHPGSTERLYTVDHLRFLRDVQYPAYLHMMWRREVQLQNFVDRSAEHARIAGTDLLGIQNSRKAFTGMLAGLHDPEIIQAKVMAEEALRRAVASDSAKTVKWGGGRGRSSPSLTSNTDSFLIGGLRWKVVRRAADRVCFPSPAAWCVWRSNFPNPTATGYAAIAIPTLIRSICACFLRRRFTRRWKSIG